MKLKYFFFNKVFYYSFMCFLFLTLQGNYGLFFLNCTSILLLIHLIMLKEASIQKQPKIILCAHLITFISDKYWF